MNPNGLTTEQIKQGYSTVPGNFDPVTGQLKKTVPLETIGTQPVDLSKAFTPQPDLVTPTLAGATNNQTAFQNDYQKYLDLQNQNQDNSLAKMIAGVSGDIEGLQGRGAAQQQAEDKLGINQFNQTLAALSSQRGSKLAELNQSLAQQRAEQAQLEAGAGAKGLTTAMLGGQQAALARTREAENQTRAAEIGLLDAQILGGQGQLKAAQDAANRAVDLMFQDREATVNTKLKQIELYTPLFNASEKKKADALTFALQKDQERLAEEKANAKGIENMVITASSQNAPQDLVERARKAKTPSEAAMILGQYAGDFYKTELLKQQIATEKAQRSKIYADMTATEQAKQSPEVEAWVNNINSGKAKLSDVPAKLKSLVSVGLASAQAKADPTTIQSSLNELDTLQKLRSDDLAIKGLSGTLTVGPFNVLYTSRLNDWKANMENTLSKLTVAELARVKNTGVTFGALSEGERTAVASAASALNSAKQYEGEGENRRWTGKFNASEEFVREKIKQIEDLAELDFQKRTGKSSSEYRQTPTSNKFLESLGQNNQPIPGTEYIKSISEDGSIDFELQKQP